MIINTSALKINVVFKGREIGFDSYETKGLAHIFTEADERELANRYNMLTFKPNPVKPNPNDKKVIEHPSVNTDINTFKQHINNIIQEQEIKHSQSQATKISEYCATESISLGTKETIIVREADIKDIKDGKTTYTFDEEGKKQLDKENEDKTDYFSEEEGAKIQEKEMGRPQAYDYDTEEEKKELYRKHNREHMKEVRAEKKKEESKPVTKKKK
jgi:hypothetical protein